MGFSINPDYNPVAFIDLDTAYGRTESIRSGNINSSLNVSASQYLKSIKGLDLSSNVRPADSEGSCYWNNSADYHCFQCYNSTDWECGIRGV